MLKQYNLRWRWSTILTCVVVSSPMCRSTSVLAPSEDLTMVRYGSSTLWGSSYWWWNTNTLSS